MKLKPLVEETRRPLTSMASLESDLAVAAAETGAQEKTRTRKENATRNPQPCLSCLGGGVFAWRPSGCPRPTPRGADSDAQRRRHEENKKRVTWKHPLPLSSHIQMWSSESFIFPYPRPLPPCWSAQNLSLLPLHPPLFSNCCEVWVGWLVGRRPRPVSLVHEGRRRHSSA